MELRAYGMFCKLTKNRRDGTYFIKEIHQPSQLRSLQAGQILFLFVMPNQGMEARQEIKRRRI